VWTVTLAELLVAAGQVDEAMAYAERASASAAPTGNRHLVADTERLFAYIDAARGYYVAARARIAPRVADDRAKGAAWSLTAALALLALCTVALNENAYVVEEVVRQAVDAYRRVPHDEPATWWAIRSTEAFLRGQGRERLARELGHMLDLRLEAIARAFMDDEPITEQS